MCATCHFHSRNGKLCVHAINIKPLYNLQGYEIIINKEDNILDQIYKKQICSDFYDNDF